MTGVLLAFVASAIVYVGIGIVAHRRMRGLNDLLPVAGRGDAHVRNAQEFSASTVAATISLATVVMAFFELAAYFGLWLLWTVLTTALGLLLMRLTAKRIWRRLSTYDHRPTLHEFLGAEFSSPSVYYIASAATSLGYLGAFAVELTVGSRFLSALLPGIPPLAVLLAIAAVGFTYSAMGGFRAVVVTDRIQMGSIWLMLATLSAFIAVLVTRAGGLGASVDRMPDGILDFNWQAGLGAFVLGVFAINVPSYVADMSIWQRVAGVRDAETIERGMWSTIVQAVLTWTLLIVLACMALAFATPAEGEHPLVALLRTVDDVAGGAGDVVLFLVTLGLLGALLSTASTQLIAVTHTLYEDIVSRLRGLSLASRMDSKREMTISRLMLVGVAVLAVALIQGLDAIGFSIADLVFSIYGAQLGLCPPIAVALFHGDRPLAGLSRWVISSISLSFIAGWTAAIGGKLAGNGDLVFLSPIVSLVVSSVLMGIGLAVRGRSATPGS